MNFLDVSNVSYSYPKKTELVLKDVSFSIGKEQCISIMGPNGSGKTTLGKILVNILSPSRGRVFLQGKKISTYSLSEIGKKIGYVFQNPEKQMFSPTVKEEIGFGLRFRGVDGKRIQQKVDEMLSYFELSHRADSLPFNLSQGEKQRLVIAATLALEPEFLILDEPTTGLDIVRKQKFEEILIKVRKKGVGYLIISHDESFCKKVTDKTFYLKDGIIYEN